MKDSASQQGTNRPRMQEAFTYGDHADTLRGDCFCKNNALGSPDHEAEELCCKEKDNEEGPIHERGNGVDLRSWM